MQEITKMLYNLEVDDFEKNSRHWVDIPHIIDPHQFYARRTKHRPAVQNIENLKPPLVHGCLEVNMIVLYDLMKSSETPTYARGKVCKVENAEVTIKCEIFALDYGYQEKNVMLDRIRYCDLLISSIPPLAVACMLANCAQRGGAWGGAIDAFKTYVADQPDHTKMTIVGETSNKLIVKLSNMWPDDIATTLALTDYTTLGYMPSDLNRTECTPTPKTVAYYKFNKFNSYVTLHVTVLTGKRLLNAFYVADVNDYKKYLDNQEIFTVESLKEKPVDEKIAKIGDLVSVKECYERYYERGFIKEISAGKYPKPLVHLVDLGRDEDIVFSSVRHLPQEYTSTPVGAIFCSAKEFPASTPTEILLQPGQQLLIKILKPGKGFETPNIVKIERIVN